jgi:hypothetical protein
MHYPYVQDDELYALGAFNHGWGYGIVSAVGHHFGVLAIMRSRPCDGFTPNAPTSRPRHDVRARNITMAQ